MKSFKTILSALLLCAIFQFSATAQVQIGQTIVATSADDGTGNSVAINDMGDRMIVGSAYADVGGNNSVGEIKVYELINGAWQQLGQTLSGSNTNQKYGKAVVISSNGKRIAIGGEDFVQVYDLVANNWEQVGANITAPNSPEFTRIRFSENGEILAARLINNDLLSVVQVYQLENGSWIEKGSKFDEFYIVNIALSDSGERLLVNKTVYNLRVYDFINGDWEQVGNDIEAGAGLRISRGIDISGNGNRVVFASRISSSEEVFINAYEFNGSVWVQTVSILPVQVQSGEGVSLRLSNNGNQFVFGTAVDSPPADYSFVGFYDLQGTQWQQLGDLFDGSAHDETANGHTDITADGTKIIYGGLFNDTGVQEGFVSVYDFSSLLSTNDVNLQTIISLFANPTSGYFTINLSKSYSEINTTITNILGQVVAFERFANTDTLEVNLQGSPGIYFVNLTTAEGVSETLKIVKN